MGNFSMTVMAVSAALVCSGTCVSCSAGNTLSKEDLATVKRDVPVGYFSKIELNGVADVKFVQGKKNSARIVGAKRLADNLDVRVKGETLVVTMKKGADGGFSFVSFGRDVDYSVTVYVSSPDLTGVSVRGSGDFSMDSDLDTDALSVSLVGSGDVEMRNVVCDRASFVQKGSGDVKVKSVSCAAAALEVTGSGDMDVERLKADAADIKLRGSGDIDANLDGVDATTATVLGSGDIDLHFTRCGIARCDVRGSGSVSLKGALKSLTQNVTGSGEVDTEELRVGR